jgi:hypothetical protein
VELNNTTKVFPTQYTQYQTKKIMSSLFTSLNTRSNKTNGYFDYLIIVCEKVFNIAIISKITIMGIC